MSAIRRVLWTFKHKPRRIEEIVGNDNAKNKYVSWLESWLKGSRPAQKAALLYGPPGVGKTLLAETSARQYGLELIELNAGDLQSPEIVDRVIGGASAGGSLFGARYKLVVFDEVDSVGGPKGAQVLSSIAKAINKATYPIVLIANDPWNPKLRNVRNLCYMIEFKSLSIREIISYLQKICKAEKLKCNEDALKIIAERSQGDMRAAILDLQLAASISKEITPTLANYASPRDRHQDIFRTLGRIFYARSALSAISAVNEFMHDPDLLMKWIAENLPYLYKDPEDLANAFNALSEADIFKARAERKRYWKLLKYYIELMSAGVAFSKRRRPVWSRYKYPESLRYASRYKDPRQVRMHIASKLAKKVKCSTKKSLNEFLPYLAIIIGHSDARLKRIVKWLDLDEHEREYLKNYSSLILGK